MSPDLAETVKRLRELAGKATPGPWKIYASKTASGFTHGIDNEMSLAVTANKSCDESNAAYIAAANPAAISSILDALEGLERENAGLRKRLRISQDQYAEADFASIQRGEDSLSGFKP